MKGILRGLLVFVNDELITLRNKNYMIIYNVDMFGYLYVRSLL